jgi:hypothetical protein
MDLVSERVLELLDDRRRSETVRVCAEFEASPQSSSRAAPGNYPARSPPGVAGRIDIVPVFPCDGPPAPALERDGLRRPVLLDVNGVRFLPKLEVVSTVVEGWMDEFLDGARGCLNTGAACRVTGASGDAVLYAKLVAFDYSDKPAQRRKNVNRIAQEVMRVKNLCQNIVSSSATRSAHLGRGAPPGAGASASSRTHVTPSSSNPAPAWTRLESPSSWRTTAAPPGASSAAR